MGSGLSAGTALPPHLSQCERHLLILNLKEACFRSPTLDTEHQWGQLVGSPSCPRFASGECERLLPSGVALMYWLLLQPEHRADVCTCCCTLEVSSEDLLLLLSSIKGLISPQAAKRPFDIVLCQSLILSRLTRCNLIPEQERSSGTVPPPALTKAMVLCNRGFLLTVNGCIWTFFLCCQSHIRDD